MKESLFGANCNVCPSKEVCPGCAETDGCPFGKQCFLAKYILTNGLDAYHFFQKQLLDEVNALGIEGMETVTELSPLVGRYVNLEYPVPGGIVKFLTDDEVYLGAQVKNLADESRYFGVIGRESFLLVCEYGENLAKPELIVYKRRS